MNLKIHTVISDILGKTGMLIISSILEGERNPEELIKYKDPNIKASDEELKKSLTGIWKDEYLFMLKQAYDEYKFYQKQIGECDKRIVDILLNQAAKVLDGDVTNLNIKKKMPKRMSLTMTSAPSSL